MELLVLVIIKLNELKSLKNKQFLTITPKNADLLSTFFIFYLFLIFLVTSQVVCANWTKLEPLSIIPCFLFIPWVFSHGIKKTRYDIAQVGRYVTGDNRRYWSARSARQFKSSRYCYKPVFLFIYRHWIIAKQVTVEQCVKSQARKRETGVRISAGT